MTRTDIHRPSTFNPADYTAQDWIDLQSPGPAARPVFRMIDLQGSGNYSANGSHQCDCCGARIRYAVVFRHDPTETYIWTGEDCAEKFHLASRDDVDQLRYASERNDRHAQYNAMLEKRPALAIILADDDHVIESMRHRGRRTGELSDRAINYAAQRVTWVVEKMIRDFRAALEPKAPVIPGRQVVTGEVVSTRADEGRYGTQYKMLVKDDRGFKVWGTIPGALNPVRGDRVTFTAQLEQSRDDESFGFFKRPTKAAMVNA